MINCRIAGLLLSVVLFLLLSFSASAQATSSTIKTASEGDTVWVVVNFVKPEMRDQFERFVHEVFWPKSAALDDVGKRTFRQTRVLHGAKPEEDGNYTYIFLMDPVIVGADYDIQNLLRRMYPKDKADAFYRMFEETLAREGEHYTLVQSKYWGISR